MRWKQAEGGVARSATEVAAYGLMLAVSVMLSLLLLRAPGTHDVGAFLHWGDEARRNGLIAGFAAIVSRFDETVLQGHSISYGGEYPPLGIAILDLDTTIAATTGVSPFIAFKLSLLAFTLASAAVLAAMTRRLNIAVAFYGTTLLGTFGLGYTDVMTVPLLVGSLVATRAGWPVLSIGLLGVDVLVKWQMLLLAPFLVIHVLRIEGLSSLYKALTSNLAWRLVICGATVIAIATAWFGVATWIALLNAVRHPFLSANALNLPWVATSILRLTYDASFTAGDEINLVVLPPLYLFPFRAIFFIVFAAVLAAAIRAEKNFENLLFFMVLGVLTYGTWNSAVHENHWFVALVPALLLAYGTRSPIGPTTATLVSVMLNVNLFIFYGVTGTQLVGRTVGIDLTLPLSVLFALAWLLLFLHARHLSPDLAPQSVGASHDVNRTGGLPSKLSARVAPMMT